MGRLVSGSVDLVFADPPFNIGYKYDVYRDKLNDDDYCAWSKRWMLEVYRILKSDGTFWLAIGDEYAAELKVMATREIGFTCRSWVIWYYTFGVNCKNKFTRSHTHLLYFVKNANQFTFNDNAIRVPSARQLVYNDKRANPCGRLPDDTWILRPQELEDDLGLNRDTWFVSRVCGTFNERAGWHGCQMPEAILERIITVSSQPKEKVLDPFLGSGTTVVVAKKLGRRFLGFELSKEYWEQCQNRLKLPKKKNKNLPKNEKSSHQDIPML
jgi:site-specific DNA-methyltransferase (adenine-specific)